MASSVVDIPRMNLELVKQIGSGGFGDVFHMKWKQDSGVIQHVAAKRLYGLANNELDIMSKLDHPNIVKLYGRVVEEMGCMLILELCEGGSLRDYLDCNGKEPVSADLFKRWSTQAARSIEYLQQMNIVHKDVKSQNFVICAAGTLKLIDFGLAKNIRKTQSNASESGTWAYMAPELLKDQKLSSTKFDIYAYAVVLWEMLTGKLPYEGWGHPKIVMHVCEDNKRLEIPESCPMYLAELLTLCWLEEYTRRPSIHQVLTFLGKILVMRDSIIVQRARTISCPLYYPYGCSTPAHAT